MFQRIAINVVVFLLLLFPGPVISDVPVGDISTSPNNEEESISGNLDSTDCDFIENEEFEVDGDIWRTKDGSEEWMVEIIEAVLRKLESLEGQLEEGLESEGDSSSDLTCGFPTGITGWSDENNESGFSGTGNGYENLRDSGVDGKTGLAPNTQEFRRWENGFAGDGRDRGLESYSSCDDNNLYGMDRSIDGEKEVAGKSLKQEGTVTTRWSNLNVRTGPWGKIIGSLPKGSKVEVLGREGDWYRINYNGQEAYVHSRYINGGKAIDFGNGVSTGGVSTEWISTTGGGGGNSGTRPPVLTEGGKRPPVSIDGRLTEGGGAISGGGGQTSSESGTSSGIASTIVANANKQLGTTRYQNEITEYGNLACAAYVSGVLKESGILNKIIYTVKGVDQELRNRGWKEVSLSDIRPGDIVVWGPNRGGTHGHIGIVSEKKGGTWYTCDNSSSRGVPVKRPLDTKRQIVRILRAPA